MEKYLSAEFLGHAILVDGGYADYVVAAWQRGCAG